MEGRSSCFWKYLKWYDVFVQFWPSCDYSVLFLTKDQQMLHGLCQVQAGWPNIPNPEGDVIRYILSPGYIVVSSPPPSPTAPRPPLWHKLTQLHDKPPLKRLPGLPVPGYPACLSRLVNVLLLLPVVPVVIDVRTYTRSETCKLSC